MKNLLPEISARELSRMGKLERRQYDETRGELLANSINRAALSSEERLPMFRGQKRTICEIPDEELASLAANADAGKRNLANMFANSADGKGKVLADYLGLANEERFTASYFSTPLTAYTVGWTDPEDLERVINFVAPKVTVNRRFEYKLAVNKEAFFSEIDDERAIGSDFNRIEYKGLTQYGKTINRGLKYRIDLDEEGAGIINEQLIVGRLLQRCRRNQWRRASAALLSLVNSPTPILWTYNATTNATPQPIEDMRKYLLQVPQLTSGVFPNRVLSDLLSWNLALNSYAHQLTAGAIAMYDMTPDDVVGKLLIDGLMVAKAIYTSAAGAQSNTTGTKSYVYPQQVTSFYGQDNPGLDDPSNLKRFVTPSGDGDFRVFRQQVGAKFVDISVEYYDNLLVTATVGAGAITPS